MIKTAILGARGYVGRTLIELIDAHPDACLKHAFSRSHTGQNITQHVPAYSQKEQCYEQTTFDQLDTLDIDVLFLALPDGIAKKHAGLWQKMSEHVVIIDLSADFRFDDNWTYGQPETQAAALNNARLIANPGCYATGMQLALKPLMHALQEPPTVFGVSGYSGAGTTPNANNDPVKLKDNLLAYKGTGHTHEKEVSHVLKQTIRFMPHVASHFRGILLTVSGRIDAQFDVSQMAAWFKAAYADTPLIQYNTSTPNIQDITQQHHVAIGGLQLSASEPGHFVIHAALDNLYKGAATQAIQNMNLACFKQQPSTFGIQHD